MIHALADHARHSATLAEIPATSGDAGTAARGPDSSFSVGTEQSVSEPADASRNLRSSIERLLQAAQSLEGTPEYLYNVETLDGKISTVFMDVTEILRFKKGRRDEYDAFYSEASERRILMTLELIDARRAFDLGKTDTAQRTYDSATRYFEQFQLSSRASFATYEGNLESARRLADRIYRTSKFAAKFLASHSGIPGAVYTIDALFTLTDFGVTQSDVGWSGATEELFINIAAGVIMKTPTESLGGKSLSQALQGDATKMIGSRTPVPGPLPLAPSI